MKELNINGSSLSERSIGIVNMVGNDRKSIDDLVERTYDIVHVVVKTLCMILAALSLAAIIITWLLSAEANQSWPKYGWWFVGASVLFFGLAAWSHFLDKTEPLRNQKRVELEKRSADDPRLSAARVIVNAIGVWGRVCNHYSRVYGVVGGKLSPSGDAVADRCYSFLVDNYPVIVRAIDYFLLRNDLVSGAGSGNALTDDPGFLAHGERLRAIISLDESAYFGQHLVFAVYAAPIAVPA